MAVSRYSRTPILDLGKQLGTGRAHETIRQAIEAGRLSYSTEIVRESQRLDHIAYLRYGESTYSWIIAAASNIGWMLQVPPGTVLKIPDLISVVDLVG